MYIAEVAPAHMRGRLASLQQMAIRSRGGSAFLSNAILARIAGGAGEIFWFGAPTWRWMFWMEAVPAVAFLLGSMIIPESPRYLIFVGKHKQALEVFTRIGSDADRLVRQVEQTLEAERRPRLSDLIIPVEDVSLQCWGWEWAWLLSNNSLVLTLFFISVRFCGKQQVQLKSGLCALTCLPGW